TLSALAVAARSELVPEWSATPLAPAQPTVPTGGTTDESSRLTLSELRVPVLPLRALDAARRAPDQFVNALLSSLEFNVRVLELAERAALARRFADDVIPLLTPKALTRAPGHPFPHLADRRVSLAVMLRDGPDGPPHFATVELPPSLPRFLSTDAAGGAVVALESVVRAHLGSLFPGREILEAHAFRVTRSGDIQLDELDAASFVQAVAEEVRRRPWGPVVRLEVERAMPPALRELLQRELR